MEIIPSWSHELRDDWMLAYWRETLTQGLRELARARYITPSHILLYYSLEYSISLDMRYSRHRSIRKSREGCRKIEQ